MTKIKIGWNLAVDKNSSFRGHGFKNRRGRPRLNRAKRRLSQINVGSLRVGIDAANRVERVEVPNETDRLVRAGQPQIHDVAADCVLTDLIGPFVSNVTAGAQLFFEQSPRPCEPRLLKKRASF